jgi:hypothetical protein
MQPSQRASRMSVLRIGATRLIVPPSPDNNRRADPTSVVRAENETGSADGFRGKATAQPHASPDCGLTNTWRWLSRLCPGVREPVGALFLLSVPSPAWKRPVCRSIRSSQPEAISADRPAMGGWMGRAASDSGFSDRPRGCRAAPSVARRVAGWQREEHEAGGRLCSASVSVVETANLGLGHDPPLARWFYLPRTGCVAFEGLVGPRVVVVGKVLT